MTFSYDGAIVSPSQMPVIVTPARPPVKLLPAPFTELLDRTEPTGTLMQAVGSRMPAELSGPPGIGKSALLRSLCGQFDISGFSTGIVYLEQRRQPADDLLHFLFGAFYDAPPNFTPVGGCLLRYLQGVQALVVIDDVTLERADIEHLRSVAGGCSFVVAGDQSRMTEGRTIALAGLPEDSARTLLERRLQRPLVAPEHDAVHEIWTSVGGNPLYLIQAAGLVLQGRATLVELAARLKGGGAATLANDVLAACTPDEKRLLTTLGALGEAPVGQDQLAAIAAQPGAVAMLGSLSGRGLVQSHSPSFTAVANVKAALPQPARPEALDRVLEWSARTSDQRELLEAAPVIQTAMAQAAAAGRGQDVIRLARIVDAPLAAGGHWGAWKSVLENALAAARKVGDNAQAGWALHQLGSRSMGLEDLAHARGLLTEALTVRQSAGDTTGAAATQHNLGVLRTLEPVPQIDRPKTGTPPKTGGTPPLGLIIGIPLIALVALVGGAVYAFDPGIVSSIFGHPTATQTAAVIIQPPLPTVARVDPSVLGQGVITNVTFTGTGFKDGMTLDLGLGLLGTNISVPSATQLVTTVTVSPDAAPGHRTTVFTILDGRKVSCNDCLTITPAPFIEGIAPRSGGQGGTIRLVVSSQFLTEKTQLSFAGTGITLNRILVDVKTHQLLGIISIDPAAPLGPRDLTTTNPDGGTSTCNGCFNVTAAPVIDPRTPTDPNNGNTVYAGTTTVHFLGSNMTQGVSLKFLSGDVTVDSIIFNNPGDITVQLTMPLYQADGKTPTPAGYRALIVTNPDGGRSQCDTCLSYQPPIQ